MGFSNFEKTIFLLFGLLALWVFSVIVVSLRAEENCLADGYPEARVTWSYKVYCVNLDGAVTTKVDRQ